MDFGLKGKTALVLGGSGGLGRAIAKSLATEGANVAVAGIGSTSIDGTVADLKAIGGKCIGLIWDLADLSVINANISKIESEFGHVDILVNNTGGPPPASAGGQDPGLWVTQFQSMGRSAEDVAAENQGAIPLGRYGKPEEYADVVAFLSSERAAYITGSVIRVDGGMIPSI